jgi:hypothetical protein
MGRSYLFECPRCGYRAKVSGKPDRGLDLFVQTILCHDCKDLHDAVIKLRIPDESALSLPRPGLGLKSRRPGNPQRVANRPPSLDAALNRLLYRGIKRFKWIQFKLQCPVSPVHRVQDWTDPGKCPRCGIYLEKSALPYRIWD